MKQVKFLAIALGLVMVSMFSANAQKIGYVNVEALVYNLPEAQKVQQDLEKWQQDSIGGTYTRLYQEYQEKDSILKKTTVASVKQVLQKDLAQLGETLGNWQQIAGQASQGKQAQLFNPLYKKVMDAVNAYAKEKGYTYVLTQEAFVVAPDSDNLSLPIATKLGIKVNPEGSAPSGGAAPVPKN
ncbi:OmpH family outer membrane protein [Niabella ginsengisoli]|uniref:OmpH family outer membrane protein n=1 Tax=Niabella ginsengisoli TaxID=522298 RepID=A0ABS9SPU0_9BACT|nr:OmpH family outer membrane protein [Niabella ginsengisoli]MCH5600390.1 OmpH family outer membrane protein [Niabella ginsengisoli]